ncbi:heme ABC transporter ATP-binding protein [Natronorubrum thiooxidans]|uniref:Cobalamin import ATP-binding protein BtuD n=1 Tax=Natronorubrum thiooxidans TaxID=308853 RepID=A0A1N7E8A1_9EURY|nr:heme ABC transporter ATP-binding protein [Natronorubrum thiooxidans]SIR84256.1 iron complex transport system ATP-binding protein [Natronorubrum thiooxidans]
MNPFERDDGESDANGGDGVEPAAITVEDCSLSFGELSVLEDVSVRVEPGEFVGFVGPNGAGKTTLLRAISGALEPDSGTVSIDGVDIHDVSSKRSSQLVSVVPQDTTLSFSFPVRDVVEMGRHPHRSRFSSPTREDHEAVERALERTRTTDLAERPIDAVSGGQRQRVVLARAVAQETPAMLLDEPTASLDINHQLETLELVRELVDEGRTVVAAIHDLDLAARYCDRLVLLADGTVHESGPPSSVLTTETLGEAFDANAVVTPNPVTNSETVTTLPDDGVRRHSSSRTTASPTDRESGSLPLPDRVHVEGTGSAAAGAIARLEASEAAIDVTLGPVSSGDVAAETAQSIGIDAIEVEPFARLSAANRERAERRIHAADVTVLADFVVGAGNQTLLDALEDSALVVVETKPVAERNFAGTAARERYVACRERAVTSSVEGILEAVVEATADESRSRSPPIDSADD